MGVAATFSQQDARRNGAVIGRDARALGVDVVLEPFVNIDRDPTWSRAFNTFGEDPLLTGQTGAGEITGIQSQGTMAMVKHFIAYDGGNNVVLDCADAARDLPAAVRRRHRRRGRVGHVLVQHAQRGRGRPVGRRDAGPVRLRQLPRR